MSIISKQIISAFSHLTILTLIPLSGMIFYDPEYSGLIFLYSFT